VFLKYAALADEFDQVPFPISLPGVNLARYFLEFGLLVELPWPIVTPFSVPCRQIPCTN
jgi:hypothetical protein